MVLDIVFIILSSIAFHQSHFHHIDVSEIDCLHTDNCDILHRLQHIPYLQVLWFKTLDSQTVRPFAPQHPIPYLFPGCATRITYRKKEIRENTVLRGTPVLKLNCCLLCGMKTCNLESIVETFWNKFLIPFVFSRCWFTM